MDGNKVLHSDGRTAIEGNVDGFLGIQGVPFGSVWEHDAPPQSFLANQWAPLIMRNYEGLIGFSTDPGGRGFLVDSPGRYLGFANASIRSTVANNLIQLHYFRNDDPIEQMGSSCFFVVAAQMGVMGFSGSVVLNRNDIVQVRMRCSVACDIRLDHATGLLFRTSTSVE